LCAPAVPLCKKFQLRKGLLREEEEEEREREREREIEDEMSTNMAMFLSGVTIEIVYVTAALCNYFFLTSNDTFCEMASEILKDMCDDQHKTNWILVATGSLLSIAVLLLAIIKRPGKMVVTSFLVLILASMVLTMTGIGIETRNQWEQNNKYVHKYELQVVQYCAVWLVPVIFRFALVLCTAPKLRSVIRGTKRPFNGYRPLLG
jgi:hypothetical protein